MFSGKTTELINKINRSALADKKCIVLKYIHDKRYSQENILSTHSGISQADSTCINVYPITTLSEIDPSGYDVIGIDEGQFYPDLIEYSEKWANMGKRVIIAALNSDYMRRPFGQVCDIVALCESVEKRSGVCMLCKKCDSSFTKRIGPETSLIDIGSKDKYITVCRQCYH